MVVINVDWRTFLICKFSVYSPRILITNVSDEIDNDVGVVRFKLGYSRQFVTFWLIFSAFYN